jgi:prolyl-tRNA editing enzyme YbaK/EbsC (Cys-tRNA(Pro) deacylase)
VQRESSAQVNPQDFEEVCLCLFDEKTGLFMSANQDHKLSKDEAERLDRLRQILDQAAANYRIFSHSETVVSAEDGVERGMGSLAEMAPTLILETEKGYIAAIISGETRLSYKKIKKALGLKDVSLAKPDVVLRETGAQVGTVSLVNPDFPTIVDTQVTRADAVYGGCGVQRHTLRIDPIDLVNVAQARVFDFTEPKEGGQKQTLRGAAWVDSA